MKSRFLFFSIVIVLLGTTILAQKKRQHFNPMVDLLEQHQVVVGGVAASFPRAQAAGGGGGRGAGAANAEAANATPAPDACGLVPPPRGAGGGGGGRGAGAPAATAGAGANPAARGGDAAANRGAAGGGAGRGAGGGGAFTPPAPAAQTMDEAAKLTIAYKAADFLNQSM